MNRISIKGTLIGGVVDFVTSSIFAFMYASWVIRKLGLVGAPHDQVANALLKTPIYVGYLVLGFGCSVLGGYIAGRIAKHDELLNGATSSFLCVSLSVLTIFTCTDPHSLVVKLLLLIASPACALLGGYLAMIFKRAGVAATILGAGESQ